MFQMSYQPSNLDSPITTVWDLAEVNAIIQKGVVQSLNLTFYGYASSAAIGVKPYIDSKGYNVTPDELSSFMTANNITPGQIQQLGYGLALSILDTNGASFFNGATTV